MSEQTPPDGRPTGPAPGAHPEVGELSAYADGELDAARASELERHVDACAACTDDLRALRLVAAELAALPAPTMPTDVAARLDEAIARERGAQPAGGVDVLPGKRRASPGWATGAAAAVAVGLLAVIGIGALSKVGGGGAMKADSDSATVARPDSAAEAAPTAVYFSGTNYLRNDLDRQLPAVAARPASAQVHADDGYAALRDDGAPGAAGAPNASLSSESELKARATKPLAQLGDDPDRLRACIAAISPGGRPVLLDYATFEGKPALVLALPNSPGLLDVFIVGPKCGVDGADDFLHWQLVRQG